MRGINVHGLIRGVITSIHDDEDVTLYRSAGQTNEDGLVRPLWAEPVTVRAQVQIDDGGSLEHRNPVDVERRAIRCTST